MDNSHVRLSTLVRALHLQGALPGHRGVLSVRCPDGFWVTPRGALKESFGPTELVRVDQMGRSTDPRVPEDAGLFSSLYGWDAQINCIARVFPPYATAASIRGGLDLSDLSLARELAIGRAGEKLTLPAYADPGGQGGLWESISASPAWALPGFLVVGGGLVVWANSCEEVEQRCELFEFLCRCVLLDLMAG